MIALAMSMFGWTFDYAMDQPIVRTITLVSAVLEARNGGSSSGREENWNPTESELRQLGAM